MTDVYVVLKESVQVKADIVHVDDVAQIYTRKDALKQGLKRCLSISSGGNKRAGESSAK